MSSETFTFYIQPWYRKSPYFEATRRHGCRSWGLYNHMLLPTLYEDPVAEYWALLRDVTLWDVSVERCVEVEGPDAFELVNLITCRDLAKVAVGKAALRRISETGVDRKLVGIEIGGRPMTDEGALNDFWPVHSGGQAVGRVTAGAWSPRLERNVGYAWVPIGLAAPGTSLEVVSSSGPVPAMVAPLPFVDPRKEIPKA